MGDEEETWADIFCKNVEENTTDYLLCEVKSKADGLETGVDTFFLLFGVSCSMREALRRSQ